MTDSDRYTDGWRLIDEIFITFICTLLNTNYAFFLPLQVCFRLKSAFIHIHTKQTIYFSWNVGTYSQFTWNSVNYRKVCIDHLHGLRTYIKLTLIAESITEYNFRSVIDLTMRISQTDQDHELTVMYSIN